MTASLDAAGIPWIELGGVVPNPRLSKVREGIALAASEGVDFILAVGGGSAIDSAKAIAIGLAYPETDVWDFFEKGLPVEKAVPVGVVLTLAATGSETSKSTVISRDEDGVKLPANFEVLRPRFAILNPELTYTLPPYQTACGVADVMSHTLERYLSSEPGGDVTGMMGEGLIKAMVKNGPVALAEPQNYEARSQIMWAGALSHADLLGVGRLPDWASHRIEHELTRLTDIAHGAGLTIIMPALFRWVLNDPMDAARLAALATEVWGVDAAGRPDGEVALEGIGKMENFFREMDLPVRFADAGIDPALIPDMADKVQRSPEGVVGARRRLPPEDVEAILKLAL